LNFTFFFISLLSCLSSLALLSLFPLFHPHYVHSSFLSLSYSYSTPLCQYHFNSLALLTLSLFFDSPFGLVSLSVSFLSFLLLYSVLIFFLRLDRLPFWITIPAISQVIFEYHRPFSLAYVLLLFFFPLLFSLQVLISHSIYLLYLSLILSSLFLSHPHVIIFLYLFLSISHIEIYTSQSQLQSHWWQMLAHWRLSLTNNTQQASMPPQSSTLSNAGGNANNNSVVHHTYATPFPLYHLPSNTTTGPMVPMTTMCIHLKWVVDRSSGSMIEVVVQW